MNWDEKAEDYAGAHHTYEHRTMAANAFGYSKFVAGAKWQRQQLNEPEPVHRLADWLFEDDHGETLAEHEADCKVPDCGYTATYRAAARQAIARLLGEDGE